MQTRQGIRRSSTGVRNPCVCPRKLILIIRYSSAEPTLKKVRACGCCRFISVKAGLSTLWARNLRALATDFLPDRLEGAFLGFASCNHEP